MEISEIIDLTIGEARPYTTDEQAAIRRFVASVAQRNETWRTYVTENPIPHELRTTKERQYTPGISPDPEVTIHLVLVNDRRAGHVQQDKNGKWHGHVTTSHSPRLPAREQQAEAVIDVLAHYAQQNH